MRGGDSSPELFNRNYGRVIAIARTFASPGPNLDDLIQAGAMGLFSACKKYDGKSDFLPFANTCIANSCKRERTKQRPPCNVDGDLVPAEHDFSSLWEFIPSSFTAQQVEILELRILGKCTFQEIGQKYGYSRNWAKEQVHLILQELQEANS